jgi:outer membrane protein assembly complex protein YaeT
MFIFLRNTVFGIALLLPITLKAQISDPIIDDIKVNGLNHYSKNEFTRMLPYSIGDVFNPQKIANSLNSLFQTKSFDDAQLLYEKNSKGNIIITYNVIEKPWVKKITIKGNNEISSTTIKGKLSNSTNIPYDSYVLEKDTEVLLNYYLTEGFVGTQIHFSTQYTNKAKNEVELIVTIYEGDKLKVNSINIQGTSILTPAFLKGNFEILKEPSLLGLMKYPLIPQTFEVEEQKMVDQAKSKGFIDFRILKRKIHAIFSITAFSKDLKTILRDYNFPRKQEKKILKQFEQLLLSKDEAKLKIFFNTLASSPSIAKKRLKDFQFESKRFQIQANVLFNAAKLLKKNLPSSVPLLVEFTKDNSSYYKIDFDVYEGKQYVFSKLEVLGSKKINVAFLKSQFLLLSPGDVYDANRVESFKRDVAQYYRDKGYFSIVIQDTPLKDDKILSMGHRLLIQEGEIMHIEKMNIKGNLKTKPFVIDRELRIKEGSAFNQSNIILSQRLLQRTGYFKSVNIIPSPGSEENLLDLTWQVEEQKTGTLQLGGGYGSETGISIYGNVIEKNFLGLGLDTAIKAQWGQYQKSIEVSIASNYINYIPVGWNFAVGYTLTRENASPRYDRDHNGVWDKIILKNGSYYFVEKGDDGFFNYYDEDRTGGFDPAGVSPGSTVTFEPTTYDDIYSTSRYFDHNMIYLEGGTGYSFGDFWGINFTNGFVFSRYNNPHHINVDDIYEDKYYNLKQDLLNGSFRYSSYIRLTLSYNSTNDPLSPTQGVKTSLAAELYGIEGGGDQFTRLTYQLGFYVPFYSSVKTDWHLIWATGINAAITMPFFNGHTQLHYENQLYFNSMEEIRGWSEYLDSAEFVGLGKISFGTELRSSIPGTSKLIWFLLFFDGGNMSLTPLTLPFDFNNYFYSVGVGVRLDFASFPLRFYLAQRLAWDDKRLFFRAVGGITFEFAISSAF